MSVEKFLAKMDDAHIASSFRTAVDTLPRSVQHTPVATIFDAFCDRGERQADVALLSDASGK